MTWTMKCQKCGADLGDLDKRMASIHIRPLGDEEIRSYFLCKECDVYPVWVCIEDFFTDEDTKFASGPIPRDKGDKIVEKIRTCSSPGEPSCRCPGHKRMKAFTCE
jgi:hypothetical protein